MFSVYIVEGVRACEVWIGEERQDPAYVGLERGDESEVSEVAFAGARRRCAQPVLNSCKNMSSI